MEPRQQSLEAPAAAARRRESAGRRSRLDDGSMRKRYYYASPQRRRRTATTRRLFRLRAAASGRLHTYSAVPVVLLLLLLLMLAAHQPSIDYRSGGRSLFVLALSSPTTRRGTNCNVPSSTDPQVARHDEDELSLLWRPEEESSSRLIQQESRRSLLLRTLSAGGAACTVVVAGTAHVAVRPFSAAAAAIADGGRVTIPPATSMSTPTTARDNDDDISNVLRPATDERPPIPLPSGSASAKTSLSSSSRRVIAEGLVYYGDPRAARPYAADTLILAVGYYQDPTEASTSTSAGNDSSNWVLLAGAKLPLNQVRLPLRFQLTTANLLPNDGRNRVDANQVLATNDLIVQAILCPEEIVDQNPSGGKALVEACMLPSTTNTNKVLQASGMAKLLRLPSLDEPIRAPVSLPLEWR